MEYISKAKAKRETGLNYLGSVSKTVKHKKSIKYGELTYSLYLSPAKLSGYEVCPGRTKECTLLCLNESGINTMNLKDEMINRSRIQKTKLFFEHKEYFMRWMIDEIISASMKAKKLKYKFSVRLNNTSDISPEEFNLNGKNILEMFPNVQFYDYTKVKTRIPLMNKYKNYHLTFSFTGYNKKVCEEMLSNGVNVAVVFETLPKSFWNYPVLNGDQNDLRHKDQQSVIVGLKYKRVRNKLNPKYKFVIR